MHVIKGVIEAETGAIEHYNRIIEFTDEIDPVTNDMVIAILRDEEGHRRLFEGYLREYEVEGLAYSSSAHGRRGRLGRAARAGPRPAAGPRADRARHGRGAVRQPGRAPAGRRAACRWPAASTSTPTVYGVFDEDGRGGCRSERAPGVRAARGERLRNVLVDWVTPAGRRSIVVSSDTVTLPGTEPVVW